MSHPFDARRTELAERAARRPARRPTPSPSVVVPPTESSGRDVNPHRARLALARSCPHRSDPARCGCSGELALCGPGGRRPGEKVSLAECLACVSTA